MSIECLQMGTKYKQHSVKGVCYCFALVAETKENTIKAACGTKHYTFQRWHHFPLGVYKLFCGVSVTIPLLWGWISVYFNIGAGFL